MAWASADPSWRRCGRNPLGAWKSTLSTCAAMAWSWICAACCSASEPSGDASSTSSLWLASSLTMTTRSATVDLALGAARPDPRRSQPSSASVAVGLVRDQPQLVRMSFSANRPLVRCARRRFEVVWAACSDHRGLRSGFTRAEHVDGNVHGVEKGFHEFQVTLSDHRNQGVGALVEAALCEQHTNEVGAALGAGWLQNVVLEVNMETAERGGALAVLFDRVAGCPSKCEQDFYRQIALLACSFQQLEKAFATLTVKETKREEAVIAGCESIPLLLQKPVEDREFLRGQCEFNQQFILVLAIMVGSVVQKSSKCCQKHSTIRIRECLWHARDDETPSFWLRAELRGMVRFFFGVQSGAQDRLEENSVRHPSKTSARLSKLPDIVEQT
eukprot:1627294-Rhodomonas_salina.2